MANPVVGIDVVARLDGLRKQLAEIPDIGGKAAKDLTAQLSKEIKSMEAATRKASAPTKDLRKEVSGFTTAAGDAGAGAKKLRGLFGLLGEDASSALGFIDDLGDGVEVFGGVAGMGAASAGLLTGAVAALGAVYLSTTAEIKRAEETEASLKRTHESLIPSERALRDIRLELAVATKTLTEAEAKQEAARNAASDAVSDYAKGQQTEREELRKSTESAQMWIDTMDRVGLIDPLGMKQRIADWSGLSDTIAQNEVRTKALDAALLEQHDIQKDVRESTIEVQKETAKKTNADKASAAATDQATEAERRRTEALRQQEEALRASIAASAEDSQLTERYQSGLAAIEKMATDAAAAHADAETKVRLATEQKLAVLQEEYQATIALATTDEQRTAATQANAAARVAIETAAAQEIAQVRVEEAQKAAEEERRIESAQLNAYADMAGAVASIAETAGENLNEDQKDAALTLFYVKQAAAMAQAAINTVLAASEASTLPYPANLVAVPAAYAVGAAQEFAIASQPPPSFGDTPGPMQMQNAGTVGLASGDYFAAAKDPADLRRQVTGATDPQADYRTGGPRVAIVGARAYGARILDDVRLGQTPIASLLGKRRPASDWRRA